MHVLPSRTTNTLPSPVATSSCVSRGSPVFSSSAVASSSEAARARTSPFPPVEPATLPLSSKTTAVWICEEISVRSARACWAFIGPQSRVRPDAGAQTGSLAKVLRRPRYAPGRDDRLLRTALLRAAHLPLAVTARLDRPGGRVVVPRQGDQAHAAGDADRSHHRSGSHCPGQRARAWTRRRRRTVVDVPLALQRARVRVQHRLRPTQPVLPAWQRARVHRDGGLAHHPVRRTPRELARGVGVEGVRARIRRQLDDRVHRLDRRLALRGLHLSRLLLLRPDKRGAERAGSATGRGARDGVPRRHVPGTAALPALRRPQPGAARIRRARDPPRLALRHVQRDRLRRGIELVANKTARAANLRGTPWACLIMWKLLAP